MPMTEIVAYIDDSETVAQFHNYNQSIPIEEHYDTLQNPDIDTLTFVDAIMAIVMDSCSNQIPGDADNNGVIDAGDRDFLDNFINHGGPPPEVSSNADPNGNCRIDQSDIVYMEEFLFQGGPPPVLCTCIYPISGNVMCGDANWEGITNIADPVYLIEYIFKGGPAPAPECVGDANRDDTANIGDAVYLINYIFKGGPAPVDDCCR
jgi:hypothetical protein